MPALVIRNSIVNNDVSQHITSTCDLILTRVLPLKMIASVRLAIESQTSILYNVLANFQFGKNLHADQTLINNINLHSVYIQI